MTVGMMENHNFDKSAPAFSRHRAANRHRERFLTVNE